MFIATIGLLAFAAAPVYAAFVQNLHAYGQGHEPASVTPDCSNLCPSGDACTCTPIKGWGNTNVMGVTKFSGTVATDTDQSIYNGACLQLIGTAVLQSAATPGDKIAIDFTGSLCGTSTANTVNAVYTIDPANSTGAFAGANGSGNLSGSRDDTTYKILGSLHGTIKR